MRDEVIFMTGMSAESDRDALRAEVARLGALAQRTELLLEVAGDLAAAVTREAVAEIAIGKALAAVGAAHGGFWVLDPDARVLGLIAASNVPQASLASWIMVPIDIDAPLPQAVRTGEPIVLASRFEFAARFPGSFERVRGTIPAGESTFAMVPIEATDGVLGALAVTYAGASAIAASERSHLAILARQCGLALERIRRSDAERTSRNEAEEAIRASDEIISVVSHDLRNPLGTILMGASTLLHVGNPDDPAMQRLRTVAERIHRQSERMVRSIQELVDFSSIQSGTLVIERQAQDAEAILARVATAFGAQCVERGLVLDTELPGGLPTIAIDGDRAAQVLASLLTTALKVTARGGRISIGALPDSREVVFFVRDTGPGIDADELPGIFERHWRSKKASYRGAGLGLTIARGIVDAHGGRIWVESQVGGGSTFYFTLVPPEKHRT